MSKCEVGPRWSDDVDKEKMKVYGHGLGMLGV